MRATGRGTRSKGLLATALLAVACGTVTAASATAGATATLTASVTMLADLSDIADAAVGLAEHVVPVLRRVEAWVALGFDKAPALAFGIAAIVALLPLTLVGVMLNRMRYSEMTRALRRRAQAATDLADTATRRTEVPAWPADAWIALDAASNDNSAMASAAPSRVRIGRRMVHIGRDEDNDIRLACPTVHRRHAVIHHNDDAEFVIRDLSSADGNGVMVNGRRVGEARLRHGDRIALGEAVIEFQLEPA